MGAERTAWAVLLPCTLSLGKQKNCILSVTLGEDRQVNDGMAKSTETLRMVGTGPIVDGNHCY